jgi:hypothetical protein
MTLGKKHTLTSATNKTLDEHEDDTWQKQTLGNTRPRVPPTPLMWVLVGRQHELFAEFHWFETHLSIIRRVLTVDTRHLSASC